MNSRLVIVDGVRTPFCRFGTHYAGLGADELGRIAVNALLTRTGIEPRAVDEVIFGCVGQPADAVNVARVIALRAGLPARVPAVTVCRNCASGAEAVTEAADRVATGRGELFIVGGVEAMTQYPLLFPEGAVAKFGRLGRAKTLGQKAAALARFRPADFKPRIGLQLGLTDPFSGLGMGQTAEVLAREHGISRAAQDAFALRSHQRALAARDRLAEEICPAYTPRAVTADNGPRADTSAEALAKLKPVFDRRHGTVTPGNASQITDGAVALLVASERRAAELGIAPLGVLTGFAYAGCDPSRMGLGPVFAIRKLGRRVADAGLVEINEAFAAQVLAVLQQLDGDSVPPDKLNVNGGAIALGHPVGATGARLVLTLLKEMRRRGVRQGLATICVGGGQGAALWLEAA